MAQLKDTVIQGDARVTGTLYAQDGTTTIPGLLSTTDKVKLDGIASGAEVNQNAFSNIKVGSTTVAADAKTDTVELVAGSNVTLTPDATNDKITIAATDTTYTPASVTPLMDGTATVGTSEKYAREDHKHPVDTSRAAASDLTSHTGNTTVHITSTERTNWNTAYTNSHTHSNKTVLDGISSANISSWNAAEPNVQADWSTTDSTSDAFIKNKPTIPTSLSQLTSDSSHRTVTDTQIADWNVKPYWAALAQPLDFSSDTTEHTTTYSVVTSTLDYSPVEGESISIYFPTAEATYPTYTVLVAIDGNTAIPVHDGDDSALTNLMILSRGEMIGVPRTLLLQYHNGFLMVINSTSGKFIYNNGRFLESTDYNPDWSVTDSSDPAYIKNKPTALSQFTTDSSHRVVTDAQISAWDSGGFTDEIILIDVSLKRYDTHRFRIASASTT